MSNSLGIATVTACLQNILQNAFNTLTDEDDIAGANVTTVSPSSDLVMSPGANVFLFHISANAAGRNSDLPTRNANGDLVFRPRVALTLHYLITFYGNDVRFEPQRLLGITVRTLHRQPVLSPALVNQTITSLAGSTLGLGVFNNSNLAAADEPVRITPSTVSADEVARLWSVFSFKTEFRLSIIYQASLLFVDSTDAGHVALPVKIANVYADAAIPPEIDQVVAQSLPTDPIVAGTPIFINGRDFGMTPQILIDGQSVPFTSAQPTQIALTLPTTLQAGTHGVQVARPRDMGTPPTPHRGLDSNLFPFALQPVVGPVTVVLGNPPPQVVGTDTLVSGQLTVSLSPDVGLRQSVVVYLNEFQTSPAPATARAYSFVLEARPEGSPLGSVTVPFKKIVAGTYLIRAQVDGAVSALSVDAGGAFVGPTVTVPAS